MLEQGYAIFTDCFVVVLNNSYDYRSSQNIDRTKLDIKKKQTPVFNNCTKKDLCFLVNFFISLLGPLNKIKNKYIVWSTDSQNYQIIIIGICHWRVMDAYPRAK